MNRVEITGRLTSDVELRKTQSGLSAASFTLAVDKISKEQTADFIPCVAWRQSAEYLAKYGKKGNWCEVSGRIQVRSYEKDGKKVYITEVIADDVHLVNGKKGEEWKTEEMPW